MLVTGQNPETLAAARRALPEDVTVLRADARVLADADRIGPPCGSSLGHLDLVFLNAGVARMAPLERRRRGVLRRALRHQRQGPVLHPATRPAAAGAGRCRGPQHGGRRRPRPARLLRLQRHEGRAGGARSRAGHRATPGHPCQRREPRARRLPPPSKRSGGRRRHPRSGARATPRSCPSAASATPTTWRAPSPSWPHPPPPSSPACPSPSTGASPPASDHTA